MINKYQNKTIFAFSLMLASIITISLLAISLKNPINYRQKATSDVPSPQCSLTLDILDEPTLTPIPTIPPTTPTTIPTRNPTVAPTVVPTLIPTGIPTAIPTRTPTLTPRQTITPSIAITLTPTRIPILSVTPTIGPHCDSSCGPCGWWENGVCSPKWGNSACCHMACVSGVCKYVPTPGVWDCKNCP